MPGKCAGIDAGNARYALLLQVLIDAAFTSPITGEVGGFTHHQSGDPGLATLIIVIGNTVVADERIRHAHDLATEAGVGADLLITGHRSGKNHLTFGIRSGTKADTAKDFAIGQGQNGIPFGLILVIRHDAVPLHPQLSARLVLVVCAPEGPYSYSSFSVIPESLPIRVPDR